MSIAEMLLPEFDQEMANTRKLLVCIPDPAPAWKPHEKSMSLARLAGHVAELPSWAVQTIDREVLDITPQPGQGFTALTATSREERSAIMARSRSLAHSRSPPGRAKRPGEGQ